MKKVYVCTTLHCSLPTYVDDDHQFHAQLCSFKRCSQCWRALLTIEEHMRKFSTFDVQSKVYRSTIQAKKTSKDN